MAVIDELVLPSRLGRPGPTQAVAEERRGENIVTMEGPSPRKKNWLPTGQDLTAAKVGGGGLFQAKPQDLEKGSVGGREGRLQEEGNPTW